MQNLIFVSFGAGVLAVFYSLWQIRNILALPAGDPKMQEIGQAILEGANAYLKKQYSLVAIVAVAVAAILYFVFGPYSTMAFLIGAILSAVSGIIGMSVSVRSNTRTAEAAKKGLGAALKVGFDGGSVTGLMVAGLALLAISTVLMISKSNETLAALGFGASLISIFARIGG